MVVLGGLRGLCGLCSGLEGFGFATGVPAQKKKRKVRK